MHQCCKSGVTNRSEKVGENISEAEGAKGH